MLVLLRILGYGSKMTKVAWIIVFVFTLAFHAGLGADSAVESGPSNIALFSAQKTNSQSTVVTLASRQHSRLADGLPAAVSAGLHCSANCLAILPGAANYFVPRGRDFVERPLFLIASSGPRLHFRPPII